MDLTNATVNKVHIKKFEDEIKLLVNQRLFDKGLITEEMYMKAKSLILKSN